MKKKNIDAEVERELNSMTETHFANSISEAEKRMKKIVEEYVDLKLVTSLSCQAVPYDAYGKRRLCDRYVELPIMKVLEHSFSNDKNPVFCEKHRKYGEGCGYSVYNVINDMKIAPKSMRKAAFRKAIWGDIVSPALQVFVLLFAIAILIFVLVVL